MPQLEVIRSAELAAMTPAERERVYEELEASAGRPNPALDAEIRQRIREFEIRYELSSDRMLEELLAGRCKETAELAEWLFWLRVLAD